MRKEQDLPFVAIFIDLRKAFDSVRHSDLFHHLMGERVPKDLL